MSQLCPKTRIPLQTGRSQGQRTPTDQPLLVPQQTLAFALTNRHIHGMNSDFVGLIRKAGLFTIQLFFLVMWGFAGIGKVMNGAPAWWGEKFGQTVLATFPGLTFTFWFLTGLEVMAFGLVALALLKGEFLTRHAPHLTLLMLASSLLIFAMLGFGQWLTSEFVGAQQIFMYFCGTLIALQFVLGGIPVGDDGSESTSAKMRL